LTALRSSQQKRQRQGVKVSRIVPKLEGPVTTPRIDTRYVVTEFGAVNLKGLSSTERVHALVGLAHPDFLDELMQAADRPRSDTDLINC
jgi:acyl-CoA hydrolase